MKQRFLLAAVASLGIILVPLFKAQSQPAQQPVAQPGKKQAAAHASQQHQDEGQHLFEAHCSRCHMAPEGFSPSISGTIVRHMRVRASLTRHEEEQLLRFFNP